MPQRTVWIREEDMELWTSVDRATLVRTALQELRNQQSQSTGNLKKPHAALALMDARATIDSFAPPKDERLYNVVVSATGVIVREKMTKTQADKFLGTNNINGDMEAVER